MKTTFLPDNFLKRMSPEDRKALGKAGVTNEEAVKKFALKKEKELHDQIEQFLRLHGVTYRHDRMDRKTTGTVGWPDFTFVWRGIPIALECKLPSGLVTPEQAKVINGLTNDGWKVRVVYSLGQVKDLLFEEIGSGTP